MSELEHTEGDRAPFDAGRTPCTQGGEDRWSARWLMGQMSYDNWQNFEQVIERAKTAAHGQGFNVRTLFTAVSKKGAGRPQTDYLLTRFAAYLVAMNGDPRKLEVAAAQTYFAVKTREAEVSAPVLDLSDPDVALDKIIELATLAKSERARADKAEKRAEIELKHRRAIEGGDGILLGDFGKKYFSDVRHTDFWDHLYKKNWLIDQRGTRTRADGEVRDGHDHKKPTYKGRPFIYEHDKGTHGGQRRFQPRVRPTKEIELRDALAKEGLPVNMHSTGLVLISNEELNELGA